MGWIEDRIAGLRSSRQRGDRTATGAYEQGRALDPDDAWDSRVPGDQGYGHGGFYNETELEEGRGRGGGGSGGGGGGGGSHLAPGGPYGVGAGDNTSYSGSGYQMNVARPVDEDEDEPRGRSRSRDEGAGQNPFGAGAVRKNPFDDDDEGGDMRAVGPRPMGSDTAAATSAGGQGKQRQSLDSQTDRRSAFRENM